MVPNKIMFDNLIVAVNEGNVFRLIENVPEGAIPRTLFREDKPVRLPEILEFIEDRIVPKGRFDLKTTLDKLGLEDYYPLKIAEKTKACLVEDPWWLSFSDADSFRNDTTRGRAGFTPWDEEAAKQGVLKPLY